MLKHWGQAKHTQVGLSANYGFSILYRPRKTRYTAYFKFYYMLPPYVSQMYMTAFECRLIYRWQIEILDRNHMNYSNDFVTKCILTVLQVQIADGSQTVLIFV